MSDCLIAANWKLNGDWALCQQFADMQAQMAEKHASVVICPPAVYLATMAAQISRQDAHATPQFALGGQNVAAYSKGAYTGEVSAAMLAEVGASYCIVGHSERRNDFAESDLIVAAKCEQLLHQSLIPILCVGEHLAQREAAETLAVIEAQLMAQQTTLACESASIVVAYEPIWAIGTGQTASPEQAQEVHEHMRSVVGRFRDAATVSLLYGGSVNPDNAQALLAMPDINGALVGGASLVAEQLLAIVDAADLSTR